jgi:acetylornithine deacetylase/succinyl-diaminopimelate desuccinylase-like protein
MKGYLACCLAMVPILKARKLKVPFHLAFSYDEEVGCTGVRPMIAELGKSLPRPAWCSSASRARWPSSMPTKGRCAGASS